MLMVVSNLSFFVFTIIIDLIKHDSIVIASTMKLSLPLHDATCQIYDLSFEYQQGMDYQQLQIHLNKSHTGQDLGGVYLLAVTG